MINAILACDLNYGIGKGGDLPWPKNSEDMGWFRETTKDGVVVMGRKTWESLGNKPLPNRSNIVLGRKEVLGDPDMVISTSDMLSTLTYLKDLYGKPIWVIGGAEMYKQALPWCNLVYLTTFLNTYDCDTFVSDKLFEMFPSVIYKKPSDNILFQVRGK